MIARKRLRRFWLVPLAILFAVGGAALLRYQGMLIPVRIASGSMAERLLGPHRIVVCDECGFAFRCGLDTESPLQLATCPNCGFDRNDLTRASEYEGDRVLIDRWAYLLSDPRRGDIIAFVDPSNESELAVKRVMGLPTETLAICRGELLVNGRLHRKSLEETMQRATLVYDDAYRPVDEHELPSRWSSDNETTAWQTTSAGYRWTADRSQMTNDWLMYRHWRCYSSPHPRTEESPVTDNDSYNQGLSRELNEVTDLLLSCDLTLDSEGEVAVLLHDGRESFTATLAANTRSVKLQRGAEEVLRTELPDRLDTRQMAVKFGVIDEQIMFALGEEVLIRHEYVPRDEPLQPTSRPLGIAGRQGVCAIANIQVYRDIYYLNPYRGDWSWTVPAAIGESSYFVLGDNSPLSNDSRHWPTASLHRNRLFGKVLTPRR